MTEHKAAPPGFVKCAKSLLDAGAPVNARNAAGRRPVEVSAFCIGEMLCALAPLALARVA